MAHENSVTLIGYLGADPEIRFMPDGTETVTLSVATTKRWKDKNGEKQEHTEWHRIVGYRQIATFAGDYAEKGDQVYIKGELRTRKWEKDGVDRYTTEIICKHFQILSGKRHEESVESIDDPELTGDSSAVAPEGAQQKAPRKSARAHSAATGS